MTKRNETACENENCQDVDCKTQECPAADDSDSAFAEEQRTLFIRECAAPMAAATSILSECLNKLEGSMLMARILDTRPDAKRAETILLGVYQTREHVTRLAKRLEDVQTELATWLEIDIDLTGEHGEILRRWYEHDPQAFEGFCSVLGKEVDERLLPLVDQICADLQE